MNKKITTKDPYAAYRHLVFQHLHYYLEDFFQSHSIKKQLVIEDAGFGGKTLTRLLKGKDMHFNCYLRLLTTMREYCKDDNEYLEFVMGFMKRAIIEIWISWEEYPEGWMLETWEEMMEEIEKYSTKND